MPAGPRCSRCVRAAEHHRAQPPLLIGSAWSHTRSAVRISRQSRIRFTPSLQMVMQSSRLRAVCCRRGNFPCCADLDCSSSDLQLWRRCQRRHSMAIAGGVFEPSLSLFDGSGNFLASTFFGTTCPAGAQTNTMSGFCYDVLLDGGVLAQGTCQIAISAFENHGGQDRRHR
jgi:hypothetical protein